jgi:hypothetical protein
MDFVRIISRKFVAPTPNVNFVEMFSFSLMMRPSFIRLRRTGFVRAINPDGRILTNKTGWKQAFIGGTTGRCCSCASKSQ